MCRQSPSSFDAMVTGLTGPQIRLKGFYGIELHARTNSPKSRGNGMNMLNHGAHCVITRSLTITSLSKHDERHAHYEIVGREPVPTFFALQ